MNKNSRQALPIVSTSNVSLIFFVTLNISVFIKRVLVTSRVNGKKTLFLQAIMFIFPLFPFLFSFTHTRTRAYTLKMNKVQM